jgi:chitodextrinase
MRPHTILFRCVAVALLLSCAILATSAEHDHGLNNGLEAKIGLLTEHPVIGQPIMVKGNAEGGISPYTCYWNTGDGQTASGKTANFTAPGIAGPFTINLIVTDSNATPQTVTVTKNISVENPSLLKASIGCIEPENPIIGQQFEVKASAQGGISPYMYSWTTSDGQTASNKTATFTAPLTTGPFAVSLTVTDSNVTPQTVTVTKNITVKNPPALKASIGSIEPEHPVIGQQFEVKASARGGIDPYTYSWTTSDGQTASNKTATFTAPLVAGPFTVSLTVTDSNATPQTVTVTKNIPVKNPPALKIEKIKTKPENPLVNKTYEVTGSVRGGTPPYTYSWNTSDGQTATGKTATFTAPSIPGKITVTLTVTDSSSPTPQNVTDSEKVSVKNSRRS